jgi:hypothetical protein
MQSAAVCHERFAPSISLTQSAAAAMPKLVVTLPLLVGVVDIEHISLCCTLTALSIFRHLCRGVLTHDLQRLALVGVSSGGVGTAGLQGSLHCRSVHGSNLHKVRASTALGAVPSALHTLVVFVARWYCTCACVTSSCCSGVPVDALAMWTRIPENKCIDCST